MRWLLIAGGGLQLIRARLRQSLAARAGLTKGRAGSFASESAGSMAVRADQEPCRVADGAVRQNVIVRIRAAAAALPISIGQMGFHIAMAVRGVLRSIPGVISAIRTVCATAVRAAAASMAAVSLDCAKAVELEIHADGGQSQAVMPAAEGDLGILCQASPRAGTGICAGAVGVPVLRIYARPTTWAELLVIEGTLYLRQAHSAEVKNGILEVR